MKLKLHISSRKGVALVIVLGLLVLILGLAIAFLNRTSIERSASASYAATASTRQLADTAVNFVQGQIHNATSQGSDVAWASQPGMIRNFDTSGSLTRAYKLYSSDNLIATSTANLTTSDIPPATWAADTAVWSDLNAPVTADGTPNFPILDPGAIGKVDGFSINATSQPAGTSPTAIPMPVRWLYVLQDGTMAAASGTGSNANITAETPANPIVGRIAFWTDDETCKININTASEGMHWEAPSQHSKKDMDFARYQPAQREFQRYPGHPATTSLSPVFWSDMGLPSATAPTWALPNWGGFYGPHPAPTLAPSSRTFLERIYKIIPRVPGNPSTGLLGSRGGTVQTTSVIGISNADVDSDRLYATVDELIVDPSRDANDVGLTKARLEEVKFFLTAQSRAPDVNMFNLPRVCLWPLTLPASTKQSPLDNTIAFTSTINGLPYYFTRQNPDSPTADFTARNAQLYSYIRKLMGDPVPGFGPDTFVTKYGASTCDQITTSIYDYIRSSINLMDSSAPGSGAARFAYSYTVPSDGSNNLQLKSGQVIPFLHPSNNTKGFGRFFSLKQAAIMFIALNANQPPELETPLGSGNWILNPMHPFYPLGGAPIALANKYPTLSGSTHKQMPFLTNDAANPFTQANSIYSGPVLAAGQTQMQAAFLLDFQSVSPGYAGLRPDFRIRVTGLDALNADGLSLGFPGNKGAYGLRGVGPHDRDQGSTFGIGRQVGARSLSQAFAPNNNPYYGTPITVSAQTFLFGGGNIEVEIHTPGTTEITGPSPSTLIQRIMLNFPNATFPTPLLSPMPTGKVAFQSQSGSNPAMPTSVGQLAFNSSLSNTLENRFQQMPYNNGTEMFFAAGNNTPPNPRNWKQTADTIRSVEVAYGDIRITSAMRDVPSSMFKPHAFYTEPTIRAAHSFRTGSGYAWRGALSRKLTDAMGPGGTGFGNNSHFTDKTEGDTATRIIDGTDINNNNPASGFPDVNSQVDIDDPSFLAKWRTGADYDRSVPGVSDGPFINKVDEGNNQPSSGRPYYNGWGGNTYIGATLFSPNRQVPSPVVLGSIPTGVNPGTTDATAGPWRTLLFCPNPNADSFTGGAHFSQGAAPKDYLLLDLFNMPVVEPYAISEPLSTAGKINMNYQIQPFNFIKRDTGLRAVLKSVLLTAVPDANISNYQSEWGGYPNVDYLYAIHAGETLKAFDDKFNSGDIFKSAAEICDIFLYPAPESNPGNALVNWDSSSTNIKNWWNSGKNSTRKSLTGDNQRERPYSYIYPRLTTKSNTYTVHYRVQALKKAPNSPVGTWNDATDKVNGEFRGSTTIERYINPNDTTIPDYPSDLSKIVSEPLSTKYKWRVINTRQFAP